ncbi:hypothetical protein BKA58DRAFT_399663 [Alternaria rosae]|uniref:uncharacterized protein n=1 Tax=Alternaria rosae TaxID=1187941 RepID=UPI001E8DE4E3|nr:uncharacterized protein BKA58DRAFT_399663 [Alternaria rosae]KAH6875458.1 hypothetical protein BKA58DRAFT_399663 [Alternaria rosae]
MCFFAGRYPFQPQRTTSRRRRLVRDAGLVGCYHVSTFTKLMSCMWLSKRELIRRVACCHSWNVRDLEYFVRSLQHHAILQKLGKPQKQVLGSERASNNGEVGCLSAALTGRVQYYLPQASTVLAISGFKQLHQYPHSSTLQSLRRSSTPLANSCLNLGDAVDARRSTSSESEINTGGFEAGTPGHHQTRESVTEPPEYWAGGHITE